MEEGVSQGYLNNFSCEKTGSIEWETRGWWVSENTPDVGYLPYIFK